MRKQVYLFELDSVRKTDKEIIKGQEAIYNEIVTNGNCVVITFNQLIDSRGFFSLLDNKIYYENFIQLCEKGYIHISQFNKMRTISQYLLDTLNKDDNNYLYSALPIKKSQRRLVELIKRSIIYSDLSEINEYINKIGKSDEDLTDLFVEANDIVDEKGNSAVSEKKTDLSLSVIINILENLYCLLKMVLRLSTIHNIYIPPRDTSEYANLKFKDYLNYVSKIEIRTSENPLWNDAIAELMNLKCFGDNNRSSYFRELINASKTKREKKKTLQYAEAIVSICANYAYEVSICNISKHYNVTDFEKEVSRQSSFFNDFMLRLNDYWDNGTDADKKFLQEETNDFAEFSDIESIPKFERIMQIIPDIRDDKAQSVPRYEYKLRYQRKKQRLLLLKKFPKQFATLFVVAVISLLLSILVEFIHSAYDGDFALILHKTYFLKFVLEAIAFFTIGEFITNIVSKKIPGFLSLSESVKGIINVFKSLVYLIFKRVDSHISNYDADKQENLNKNFPIDFCINDALNKYIVYYEQNPDLFKKSSEYPIVDVTNRDKLKQIIRNQEITKNKYGVVYKNEYNTVFADPIENNNYKVKPYMRVIPTSLKNGVVLLVKKGDNFVLIRQFRHSIRKEQLCCPRGFGEIGINSLDNAKKELYEELSAKVVDEPVELGSITADSGLSSGGATVFLMKIESYSNKSEEGIREIVEMKLDEIKEKVRSGEIDDGYTLGALYYYSIYINGISGSGKTTDSIF